MNPTESQPSAKTRPGARWSTALYVLAFPFELLAYAVARMRGKGFGMMLILIILVLPLVLWLFFPFLRRMGIGWFFFGAFVAATMVVAAKTRMQTVEMGSLDCGYVWKLMVFIPGAVVFRLSLPSSVSMWFVSDRWETMVLASQITKWTLDILLPLTAVAAALRHYYEPRWRRAAKMDELIAAGQQVLASAASAPSLAAGRPEATPGSALAQPTATAGTGATSMPAVRAPSPQITSHDPAELLNQADILINTGRWEFAHTCLERLLGIDPSNAKGQTRLAETLFHLERFDEARAAYQAAIELNPNDLSNPHGLGQCHFALGDPATAAAVLEACVQGHPKSAGAWADLGQCYIALNRHEEALNCCSRALAIDSNQTTCRLNKAYAEESLGRTEDAAKTYQQFLNFAPPHMAAEIQYARDRLQQLRPPSPA